MTGAGISVSAGIPDFRSPGTGLYDNLQKYNLPRPEAIFDIGFFEENPEAFCLLAKELYPGNFCATPTHCFIRLLAEKKVLLRNFTQNIDTLEFRAGIPEDLVVQAHGGFSSAHCIKCKKYHNPDFVKKEVFANEIPRCQKSAKCNGLVKPDIVFFGENLPRRYWSLSGKDFPKCDLLLILGTSLQVHPFAGLIDKVPKDCVRVLFNRDPVGQPEGDESRIEELRARAEAGDPMAIMMLQLMGQSNQGLLFGRKDNKRDIFIKGDCDNGVKEFADALGWTDDLEKIVSEIKGKFKKEQADSKNM
eukprot:CAMPEP_0184494182 /NCGR_PEP_ID=MMETSP0113_2-20130426/28069_1 /TAXON_ID=91329 /ORGANISM="Norrisiella sphaerica, Strain BC52" /LENGTH=303 /DNA_ID=CAMNT_0026879825 /DNA_START=87 /DNA_END=998 /DNA_ORIENTATION=-